MYLLIKQEHVTFVGYWMGLGGRPAGIGRSPFLKNKFLAFKRRDSLITGVNK